MKITTITLSLGIFLASFVVVPKAHYEPCKNAENKKECMRMVSYVDFSGV